MIIETEIGITVNMKSDLDIIQQKIIEQKIKFPVYILEYEFSWQINFTSDYEEWKLDTAILNCFPGYEYTNELERGRKEIRIQVSRHQSELSTNGWGSPIENPLNETKYLIKKSAEKLEKFSPKIRVLFEDKEQHYYVNIVNGINKANDEQGFLLLDDFKNRIEDNSAEILKDALYKSPLDAFHSGYHKLVKLVDTDFTLYWDKKKKETREVQKLPRKIVRDFIGACNSSDENEILKNLDKNIIFEKQKNFKTLLRTEGIAEFKRYISYAEQELSGRDFKIRSSWDFNLPELTIGIKYFTDASNPEIKQFQKYEQIKFRLNGHKIISIIYQEKY